MRGQLENVDIARKTATTQAESNKQLANDLRDVYEDKLARLAKKCEQWRREADKQNSEAKRYREERNKCESLGFLIWEDFFADFCLRIIQNFLKVIYTASRLFYVLPGAREQDAYWFCISNKLWKIHTTS